MKRKYIYTIVVMILLSATLLFGCQSTARKFGGTIEIDLPPNTKLELITWRDDDLWYLVRPMRSNEEPEVHKYIQSSDLGIFEGEVIINETKDSE